MHYSLDVIQKCMHKPHLRGGVGAINNHICTSTKLYSLQKYVQTSMNIT